MSAVTVSEGNSDHSVRLGPRHVGPGKSDCLVSNCISAAHTGYGRKRVTAAPQVNQESVQRRQRPLAGRRGPAGNPMVMEEGFARVIVQ